MNVSDPLKPKRRRANSDNPSRAQDSEPPAPANDAGASVFGFRLDDETFALCAKLSCWTAREAAYFSAGCKLGCETLAIPSFGVEIGWLNDPILYRQTLFERHLLGGERGGHITPLDALQLLESKGEWVDPEMRDAVLHFHAPRKRKQAATLKPHLGDFMPEDDDEDDERPEALKRKLSTARKIILGFSMDRLGHQPGKHFNSTSKVIAAIMKKQKLDCDEDTIRKHLKAAKEDHWVDPSL